MSRSVSVLLAVVLTAVPIAFGVALADVDTTDEPVAYEPRPLTSYDTSELTVAREAFCARIPAEAVVDALGGEPDEEGDYAEGDDLPSGDGVAHEHGCWARTASGAEATAWVFTPPTTAARAQQLAEEAAAEDGCEVQDDAPAYGDPSVAVVCGDADGVTMSHRGLFGDAWLSCSLSLPGRTGQAELAERAGRWCVAVAEAAAGDR